MRIIRSPARFAGFSLTGDGALGALGGCLAVGALSFGVYMNVHGPSASLGTSRDFTVFAQLAPHGSRQARPPRTDDADALDTTATATIPARGPRADADGTDTPTASIFVAAADGDSATMEIEGRLRTMQVGDDVPGAGKVLAILPGAHPLVKTSRGFTFSSRER